MRRSGFVRAFALVALVAQFQQLPALVACTLRHQALAMHCEDRPQQAGPVLSQADGALLLNCAGTDPCMASGPVVAPTAEAAQLITAGSSIVAAGSVDVPPSFDASPTSPPPQA